MAINELFEYSKRSCNSPEWVEEKKFVELVKYSDLITILIVCSINADLQFIAYGSALHNVSEQTRKDIIHLHLRHPDSIVSPFAVSIDETKNILVLKYLSSKHRYLEDDKKIYDELRETLLNYLSNVANSEVIPNFHYSVEDIT